MKNAGVKIAAGLALVLGGAYAYQLYNFGEKVQTKIAGLGVEVVKAKNGLPKAIRLKLAISVVNPTALQVTLQKPYVRMFRKSDPVGHVAISLPSDQSISVPANGTAQIDGITIEVGPMDIVPLLSISNGLKYITSLFGDSSKSDKERVSGLSSILKEPLYVEYSTVVNGIPYKAPEMRLL